MSQTTSDNVDNESNERSNNHAAILGIGSAFPRLYSQDEVRDAISSNYKFTSDTLDFMHRVFDGTKFDSSAVASEPDELGKRMSRTEYVAHIKHHLKDLSLKAVEEAIQSWGGTKSSITHLVFGTMTQSIHAPTMDVELTLNLGLPMTTKRLNVEGMGCFTGFRCLALGATIAEADPTARVLVVCSDIRSALINQMPEYPTRKHLVTAALFRDSAGAVVVGCCPQDNQPSPERALFTVKKHESMLIPDSLHIVSLTENDSSEILLDLSKDLPKVVSKYVKPMVNRLTDGYDVDLERTEFALHTGGPRIVKYVAESLGLPEDGSNNMRSTWQVMKKYGNLSGSSNIVVLNHILKREDSDEEDIDKNNFIVCLSMGPGMALEGLLLERSSAPSDSSLSTESVYTTEKSL